MPLSPPRTPLTSLGLAWIAAGLAVFAAFSHLRAEPDYITSEAPVSGSLETSRSATDSIGEVPPFDPLESELGPQFILPRIRQLVPKTGIGFIDESVFSVRPRSYYRNLDNGDGTYSEAWAVGGALGLQTGWIADSVRLSVTGFTSQKLYGPEGRDGTGLLRPEQQSYTVLGEVFGEFKTSRTASTFGRQRIDAPYINANDSRMSPNTFEALLVRSLDLKPVQLGFGHIWSIRPRAESDFISLSEAAGAVGVKKGVTGIGARWNVSETFHVSLVDQYGWDMFNTFYAESEKFIPINDDLSLKLGGQLTRQSSVGDEVLGDIDVWFAAGKLSFEWQNIVASTSFTWTSDSGGVNNPWGGDPSYNSVMISNFNRAGERSVRAGLFYDFSNIGIQGLSATTSWLYGNTPETGSAASPDQREFDITVDYQPPIKSLDSFWFRVRYASNNRDAALGGLDRTDLRIILNYSFNF